MNAFRIANNRGLKAHKLRKMIEICDGAGSVEAFRGAGGSVKTGASTNTIRYAGVVASCTWSADSGLVAAWRKAALRYLEPMGGPIERATP